MAGFAALITFFLCTQLRKNLKRDGVNSPWSQYLLYAMCTAIALMAMSFNYESRPIFQLLIYVLATGVVTLPYTVEEFRSSRSLVNAVIPIVAVGLLTFACEHLLPKLYESIDTFMESAIWFAVIWFCAMWFINRRQNKALEIERVKRRNEEEQNRMMAARKITLESEVKQRTAELTQQKEELQQTLAELKSTQAQLVQQEKMASLGELTAGIAHEIQNPLNFVNNFSEVSIELLDELKEDILSKLPDETKEEADDINALADEYLRLSYHGLRAKDKAFNAGMKTSFDETIGNIDAMAQDLGRVLLNLYNNSFYSVAEKKKLKGEGYEPMVNVSTKHITLANGHNAVEITVSDNGMGIPQKVLDKIYQPFFTTKPTGQGTGLGLSMSYDIVTKAHNGELKVDTQEGEYAKFTIIIPTNG